MHMRAYGRTEGFFIVFHEITSSCPVRMQFNSSGYHIAPMCINNLCSRNGECGVGNFKDTAAVHYDAATFHPTLGSKNAAVNNLFHGV